MSGAQKIMNVAIAGDSGCGKSTLTQRFRHGSIENFSGEKSRVGLTMRTLTLHDDTSVRLALFDLQSSDMASGCAPLPFLRSIDAVLFVFDCSKPETFDSIEPWSRLMDTNFSKSYVFGVVANKLDLMDAMDTDTRTSMLDGWAHYAKTIIGASFFVACSALTQTNCDPILSSLTERVLHYRTVRLDLLSNNQLIVGEEKKAKTSCAS